MVPPGDVTDTVWIYAPNRQPLIIDQSVRSDQMEGRGGEAPDLCNDNTIIAQLPPHLDSSTAGQSNCISHGTDGSISSTGGQSNPGVDLDK